MPDRQYTTLPAPSRGLPHRYGERVFLHSNPWALSALLRLCAPTTTQPLLNHLVAALYDHLLHQVVGLELSQAFVDRPTRMAAHHPRGRYAGQVVDPAQEVVVVDIARAGMLPALRFFEGLSLLLDPARVRQDHVFSSRLVDEHGEVVGADLSGAKVGGPASGRLVLCPDPMGATGTSMVRVMDFYRDLPGGPPARFVAVHLIVTPEYLRRVLGSGHPVHVHAVRLDRGLSSDEALAEVPGARWDEEQGLNGADYIIPGAGGLGELMNNTSR
ncbi:MAG: uracil phosphoribosyltransferase [Deltaproteobacteria bacterium]|nr:uracil phosphoribosyltransferase [Deltaproteobacteria bacterium]